MFLKFLVMHLLSVSAQEPAVLACIAGLPKCIGVPDVATASSWGCPVMNITDCSGATSTQTCGACITPRAVSMGCFRQDLRNDTSQDGTPVTFSLPVDVNSVKPQHFQWRFADGSTRTAGCAIRGGNPASEANELQTIAILGNAGGWGDFATSLEIIGDILLIKPDGSKVSAKGLAYSGPSLDVDGGPLLLTAKYEVFSTSGETLRNNLLGPKVFPNHCQHLFPDTTHRISLLFDGGVTLDGKRALTPDRTDIFQVSDVDGEPLPSGVVLGLADLGSTAPQTQCEKDTYVHDQDNYVDICLKMSDTTPLPATVHLPCDENTIIVNPKGSRYPCAPQTVEVSLQASSSTV
mmetsp:Transcript_40581/g.107550  ORF Transcript_40581/g.107550 Transcript_40581/m.107550 type:complete len:349 (-) Transcript_40581:85-1131(-)|eukprot:CAMPEP_0194523994 /NCGR_PEP_ID=MMETSP0253-20130528/59028_1 /TAXON_ID=2966 /ORGANISM="Noctiluca scintillans" /LENGTH=348 /DNA_ID=CAMNT_0039368581 /DNA_START=79 /DNA_END=1125 /DNA_ORIENTATION=+